MKDTKRTTAFNMTQGSPTGLLLRFSVPLLIGNIFQQLYSLVDSVVIGRFVGPNELGGIGCTGSIDYLVFSIAYGMSSAVGIITAIYYGAGDKKRLNHAIYNCFYVLFAVSLLIAAVGFFGAGFFLELMNTPPELLPHGELYLKVLFLGNIATIYYGGISAVMRAFGDSKTPLLILIFCCLLNIVLDLLFVLCFHWSVFGVALATVISQTASAVLSFWAANRTLPLFRYQKGSLKPDKEALTRCIKLGLPLAGQNMLIAVSTSVLQASINSFGAAMVTAVTTVGKLDQIVQQPYGSMATALETYTGQNLGAGKEQRIRQGLKSGILVNTAFTLLMLVLIWPFGPKMLGIFVQDAQIIAIGTTGLRINSVFYVFLGLLYAVRGVLNGAGDAVYSAINGIIELVCRILFALVLIPKLGMWGCFLCGGVTWVVASMISLWRYASGKWKGNAKPSETGEKPAAPLENKTE